MQAQSTCAGWRARGLAGQTSLQLVTVGYLRKASLSVSGGASKDRHADVCVDIQCRHND
jgi:hypothetical protein